MGLRLIPHEAVISSKKITLTQKSVIQQIRKKLHIKEISRDERIVLNTYIKMTKYVSKKGQSLDELNDLLENMERSILALRRAKTNKIDKKRKKRKNN